MATLSGVDVACPVCGDAVPVTYSAVLMPPAGGVAEVVIVPNIGTLRAHLDTHAEIMPEDTPAEPPAP